MSQNSRLAMLRLALVFLSHPSEIGGTGDHALMSWEQSLNHAFQSSLCTHHLYRNVAAQIRHKRDR